LSVKGDPRQTRKAPRHRGAQGAFSTRSVQPNRRVWRVAGTRQTLHVCCGAPWVRRPSRADLEPGGCDCSELRACQRGWKRLAWASLARCAVRGVKGFLKTQPVEW